MLERSPAGRIVTVSSKAAAAGSVTHLDLRNLDGYRPTTAYNASKLANLLFAFERQQRLAASDSSTISLALTCSLEASRSSRSARAGTDSTPARAPYEALGCTPLPVTVYYREL
ncbi:hypothetical protein AB0A95_13485 [Micromonospora sp. NPDC049230]|uniref:hypothetical protein n=1 Tax=Micromonospora sp. NPDC049230 TaxID=3155502 RepID=UPI0033FC8C67